MMASIIKLNLLILLFAIAWHHVGRVNGQQEPSGPRFLSEQPTQVAFTPDRGWTLDCPAQGQPPPQITWLSSKGSGSLWSPVSELANLIILPSSSHNGSLTLLPFRPEHFRPDVHSTVYKCAASNSYGKILSTPVRLRAVMLPPFDATVDSPRVRRGGTAVFRCSVPESVRDHVTITSWVQDSRYDIFLSSTSSSQDGRHVMLPSGELHVLSVRQGDDSHLYHCRLLVKPNGQTLTSSTAGRILLQPDSTTKSPPVILENAGRVRAWRGQEVVLPCVHQGYPLPRVKWFRSQTAQYGNLMLPIVPSSHGGRHRLVGGTLIISSVLPEDQGRYVCSVNNSVGSSESRTELLFREKLQARIVETPSLLTVDAETDVTITCSFSGSPRPQVSWMKDGQRYVGNNGRISEGQQPDTVQLIISPVTKEDQGMYQCFVSNDEGDWAQATVQLAIGAFPPHLKQTFTRQILHPGSSVSFKCLASGTPLPHFTWTLDGYPLPVSERYFLVQQQTGVEDQVVSHLNISHVRVEDGGNYKCTAENRVGKVEHTAALHVYGAPYVRPMSNVAAVAGKRLELACPVAGYPIESIIWEKDGRRLPLNTRQRIQFNGSLIIDPVDRSSSSDAGTYTCEARGQSNNLARQSLQLSIMDAPYIMPMSETSLVNAGERLALQCAVVKGGLPLTVAWLKDGEPISGPGGISVKIINDFTASLTVEALAGHHSGAYTCRASNPGGRAQASVQVIVQAGPRIAPFSSSASRSVMVNSRVQMSCVIEEGDPPFTIRWLRNGRPVTMTPSSSSMSGIRVTDFNAYSSILTVDQVGVHHGGNYTCRAENAAGSALHAALLQVSVPPLWIGQPPPEVVQTVRGHSVELSCAVSGIPAPVITWSFTKEKRGEKYSALFSNNRTLLTNQSLVISPVEVSDQGYYHCEASNGVGNSLSALMAVQVHSPPEVELNQDYTAIKRGSSGGTVLKCLVKGDPPLNIQWRKDSVQIDVTSSSSRISTKPDGTGKLISELTVINAASADEGLYECTASNIYGEDRDSVFIQVQDVPQPPQEVRVTSVGSRTIQLEWISPSSDGGNPIKEFVILYKAAGDDVRQERVGAGQLSGTLNNLQPATSYQVHVTASNAVGQSQPGAGLTVTTEEEAPQGPPLDVSASLVTSRGFTLSWSPPAPRLQNGLILSYLVTLDSPNRTVNRTIVPSSTQQRLTGLRPNTNHVVYVQAVNGQGSGPPSPSLTVRTAEDVPDEGPLNVACVSLNSQSLQITWQPPRPEHRNGFIRGYKVLYEPVLQDNLLLLMDQQRPAAWDNDGQSSAGLLQQTTSELTVFLSNLQKFSNYSVQVLAFTSVGDGVRSAPLICTTEEDIPDMPVRVKVVQSGPDSLSVLWLPNPRPTGRITHYNVYSKEIERGQEGNPQKWTVAGASAGRLEVRNLRPRRTVFYFQVAAVSSQAGEGPRSPTVSFTFSPAVSKISAAVLSIGADYLVAHSSRLILPCSALGEAPLQLAWYQDGRQLTSDWLNINPFKPAVDLLQHVPAIQSVAEESAVSPAHQAMTNGSLLIHRLDRDGGGNYTCVVRNKNGQDSSSYTLTVVVPPLAPQLRFAASNWSSITLQWSGQSTGNGSRAGSRVSPTRSYFMKYRPRRLDQQSGHQPWTELSVSAGLRTAFIGDLHCGSEYEFVLLASSRVGNSTPSNSVTARTKGSPPEYSSEEEGSPDLTSFTATSCTVDLSRWQDRGCPIQQFIIRFRTKDQADWIIAGAESPPQSTFLLGGLQPGTSYVVRVTATNQAGSTQREYLVQTLPLLEGARGGIANNPDGNTHLALLFSDPRVAVPIGISCLAILLTLATLFLRYRYHQRSAGLPHPPHPPTEPVNRHSYGGSEDYDEDHQGTLAHLHHPQKTRTAGAAGNDPYGDGDVSPYAVFMPKFSSSSNRTMMKTFVVSEPADKELEMSNCRAGVEEPTYDYISPCRPSSDLRRGKINPQSVFVPITPARERTWTQQQLRAAMMHHPSMQQNHQDWNNQATLAISQRL